VAYDRRSHSIAFHYNILNYWIHHLAAFGKIDYQLIAFSTY